MLGRVAVNVVVLMSLLAAMTAFEIAEWQKVATSNGAGDCASRLYLLWVLAAVFAHFFFALFGLEIFANGPATDFFAIFGFGIFALAAADTVRFPFIICSAGNFHASLNVGFAINAQPIAPAAVFVKLRHRFDLLAMRAVLRYDCFRHILSFAKSMFWPPGTEPGGLFYFNGF